MPRKKAIKNTINDPIEGENKSNIGSRNFCFTINNYTNNDLTCLNNILNDKHVRYCISAKEIGKQGTPHIQGYIELNSPMRMKALNLLLGNRASLRIRRGSSDENVIYCKKDGDFKEMGSRSKSGQGARSDLYSMMECIRENVPELEMCEIMPETCARFMRFASYYRSLVEAEASKPFRFVTTIVVIGKKGQSKSRWVREQDPDIFEVNCMDPFPFDGYQGEKSIILDDFGGKLPYSQMLRILDGYRLRLSIKGGHRYAMWDRVYITDNDLPDTWYQKGLRSLRRRIHYIFDVRNSSPKAIPKDLPYYDWMLKHEPDALNRTIHACTVPLINLACSDLPKKTNEYNVSTIDPPFTPCIGCGLDPAKGVHSASCESVTVVVQPEFNANALNSSLKDLWPCNEVAGNNNAATITPKKQGLEAWNGWELDVPRTSFTCDVVMLNARAAPALLSPCGDWQSLDKLGEPGA